MVTSYFTLIIMKWRK